MSLGFYIIMAAQFFSALADNALLIAAIAILRDLHAPAEYEPLLKTFFTVSYVALAAFVGAFADSMPKWRGMFLRHRANIPGRGPVVFIGISMGGMVAQGLAVRHPDLLRGVVIAHSSARYPEEARATWAQRIALIEREGLGAIADATMEL